MKSKISALLSRLLIALKLRKPAKTKDVIANYRAKREDAIKSLDQVRVENSTVAARYDVKASTAARNAHTHHLEANTAVATQQNLAVLALLENNLTTMEPVVVSCPGQPTRRAESSSSSHDSCSPSPSFYGGGSSSYDSGSSSSSDSGSSSTSSTD